MKHLFFIFFIICFIGYINAQSYSISFPKHNQVLSDTNITIQWDESINALSYQLQIATDSLFQNIILDSSSILSSEVNFVLVNGNYYSRVKPNSQTFSSSVGYTVFSPNSIDSLILWLVADSGITKDASNKISQWNDQSGLGHHAFQSVQSKKPEAIDSVLGSHSAVSLMGGLYYVKGLYDSISPSNYRRSIFLLFNNHYIGTLSSLFTNYSPGPTYKNVETSIYSNRLRLWLGNGSSYKLKNYPSNFGGLHIMSINIDNSNAAVYNNSSFVNQLQYPYQVFNTQKYLIGGESLNGSSISNPFNGQVFEIIDYAKPLDSAEIQLVNKYLLDKYTPPVNLGQNILRRYGFCDTTLATEEMYESYLWSTGDTTRSISISKEDTGWYWCEVPNLFGNLMRDSVYVYDLLPKQNFTDTTVCLGDTLHRISVFPDSSYNFVWQKVSSGDTLSTTSVLNYASLYEGGTTEVISLKIHDTLSCYTTDTFTIYIDSFPVSASLGPDKSLCSGDKIGLVVGANEADSFLWNNGSGDSLIVINNPGTYNLQTWNSLGCSAKDTIVVDIHGVTPYVSFFADTVCFKDSTIFIDSSQSLDASNLILWQWNFGDGSQTLPQPQPQPQSHLYLDSGTYTVRLTVSTDSNCSNYAYKNIYIRPLPEPNFYPVTGCQNLEITFNNFTTYKDSLVSFYWDFGNGNDTIQSLIIPYNTLPNITTIYNQSGNYNTLLTATDIHGCSDSIIQQVNIKSSPFANFNYSTSCDGDTISFADNSTTEPYNPIQSWQWVFDSSSISTSPSPSYHFDSAGYYSVNLKTIAINHCWDTITKQVPLHPFIRADFNSQPICKNHLGTLFGQATYYSNVPSSVDKYEWHIDNVLSSVQQNVNVLFNDTIEHKASFYILSTAGCEDSIIKSIKSHPRPIAAFTTDKEYGLPPLTISFTNLSTSTSTLTYLWDFGDNNQSTIQSPIHSYLDSAIFYPMLTVTNTFSCWDTVSHPIYVVYAAIDVAVTEIRAKVNQGFISYSCKITNFGKQKLKKLNLFAKYNSGTEIYETWTGSLLAGESVDYNFISKAQISNNQSVKYFCVRAELPEESSQKDENNTNNSLCKDISNEFWIGQTYPNPVTDNLFIDVIVPYSQDIELQLSDIKGNIIQEYKYKVIKGLNQISISTNNFESGQYILYIKSNETFDVRKFMVL